MAESNRTLALQREKNLFTDPNTNKQVSYVVYYVIIAGVKIKLRPVDATAKQILDNFPLD